MSPCSSRNRRGLSLRFKPPNRKIAGSPSDTETIGAAKSLLVPVLMQRHARARLIAVDQAGIRREAGKARLRRRLLRQARETTPASPATACRYGIVGVVAIAAAVGDPAASAAIGHRHRHLMAARRHHVAERRLRRRYRRSAATARLRTARAKPRSSTAPSAIASRDGSTSRCCQTDPLKSSHSFRIVKDHANGVAMAGSHPAHAMAQINPISAARPLHRTMMHSKGNGIALA